MLRDKTKQISVFVDLFFIPLRSFPPSYGTGCQSQGFGTGGAIREVSVRRGQGLLCNDPLQDVADLISGAGGLSMKAYLKKGKTLPRQ